MTKILIIEDHAIIREGLANLLEQEDDIDIVGQAGNGRQALQLLADGVEADIILSDLHLRDISGITLALQFKERLPAVKIIILTAEDNMRYVSEAFRAGVNGYLLKETDYDELLFGIRKVKQNHHFICTGLTSRLSERLAHDHTFTRPMEVNVELSSREAEVLRLLSDGYTNIEIADRLFTSRRTVEGHRQSLLNKAGVRNTPELIKYAMLHGLIQIPSTIN